MQPYRFVLALSAIFAICAIGYIIIRLQRFHARTVDTVANNLHSHWYSAAEWLGQAAEYLEEGNVDSARNVIHEAEIELQRAEAHTRYYSIALDHNTSLRRTAFFRLDSYFNRYAARLEDINEELEQSEGDGTKYIEELREIAGDLQRIRKLLPKELLRAADPDVIDNLIVDQYCATFQSQIGRRQSARGQLCN